MVGWFEIPVADMHRAKKFYQTVFNISISIHEFGGFVMGWFPSNHEKPGATGSLVKHEMYKPNATERVLIYFSCKDLADELSRVEAANGEIIQPKTEMK